MSQVPSIDSVQIFGIFDRDGNGSIDFREFMLATDTAERGGLEDKVGRKTKMGAQLCQPTGNALPLFTCFIQSVL